MSVGGVENVTVSPVAEAAVTVPAAPCVVNTTELFSATGSKSVPVMIIVSALIARFLVVAVIVGDATTVATWASLLAPPSVVTVAFKAPTPMGGVENVTVSSVSVAAVTVPAAPSVVNTTELFSATGSKSVPVMITVGALMARLNLV